MKGIILFVIFMSSHAVLAGDFKKCKEHFVSEISDALVSSQDLINAQLTLTSLKLAKKITKTRDLESQSIESYAKAIIGSKTHGRLANTELVNNIRTVSNKFRKRKKIIDPIAVLNSITSTSKTKLSDSDISSLMVSLQETWKGEDDFGFTDNDIAFTSFISEANLASGAKKESFIVSNFIKKILNNNGSREALGKSIKEAYFNLKAEVAKIKNKVYTKYREDCLDYWGQNKKSKNAALFNSASCRGKEDSIISELLLDSMEEVIKSQELSIKPVALRIGTQSKPESQREVRKIQDEINKLKRNKDKVISFYKNGLAKDNCDAFLIVDKNKNTTSLHSKNGDEILSVKSLIGVGKMNSRKDFNDDSVLRWYYVKDKNGNRVSYIDEHGKRRWKKKYTKTTGAGTYSVKRVENKNDNRNYDVDYNGKMMVWERDVIKGERDIDGDGRIESIEALHILPKAKKIGKGNLGDRQNGIDIPGHTKKLTTGCVNVEEYSFDLINGFMDHKCPIYVLPADKDNYYNVKNGNLEFSSHLSKRKKQKENSKMILTSGKKINDPRNTNRYNFTKINKYLSLGKPKGSHADDEVLLSLIDQKNILFSNKDNQLENDDFEDLISITTSLTNSSTEAISIYKKLQDSFSQVNPDERLSTKKKRELILKQYKEKYKPSINIKSVLADSLEIDYEY